MSSNDEQFRENSSAANWNIIFRGIKNALDLQQRRKNMEWLRCVLIQYMQSWNETVQLTWLEMSLLHHKYLTCHSHDKQALSTCYLDLCVCREEPAVKLCQIFFRFVIFSLPPPEELPSDTCWHIWLARLCANSLLFEPGRVVLCYVVISDLLTTQQFFPILIQKAVCKLSQPAFYPCLEQQGHWAPGDRAGFSSLLQSPMQKIQLWICLCSAM